METTSTTAVRKLKLIVALVAMLLVLLINVYAQGAEPVVATYDKVLEYIKLEVKETKIIELIEASPTAFVLSAEQVDALRTAGASDELLAAIAKKTAAATQVTAGNDVTEFVLILDCSGSMNDALPDGGSKWQAARQAAIDLVTSVPEGRKLSLIVYGRDAERQCQSVDLVRPLTPLTPTDRAGLVTFIRSLRAVGHTPIARSLHMAGEQLESATGMASVVLITDGMESCHADPAAEAAQLVTRFKNLTSVNVVGFCLGEKESSQVAGIAKAGKGEFFDSKSAVQLTASIRQIQHKIVRAKIAEEEVNLETLSPIDRLLIEQLSDTSMDVREAAARGVLERKVTAAVPALAKLILTAPWGAGLDNDMDRHRAIQAVMGLAPEKAGDILGEALSVEPYKTRVWAATAILGHNVRDAAPAVEARLLAMGEDDVNPARINGADEANALFQDLRELAPERVEAVMVQLIKSPSAHKRAWATSKIQELK